MRHRTRIVLLTLLAGIMVSVQSRAADTVDVKPVPIKTPAPFYPEKLKRAGISGVVAVRAEIDENGVVSSCIVARSSNSELNEYAVTAVKTWKFKPAQKDGSPVKSAVVIPIAFTIED